MCPPPGSLHHVTQNPAASFSRPMAVCYPHTFQVPLISMYTKTTPSHPVGSEEEKKKKKKKFRERKKEKKTKIYKKQKKTGCRDASKKYTKPKPPEAFSEALPPPLLTTGSPTVRHVRPISRFRFLTPVAAS